MKTFDIYFYHANCTDGLAAVTIAAMGQDLRTVDTIPLTHGTSFDVDIVAGKDVCFLDFSVTGDLLRDVVETANSVTIIDHHKSVYDDITRTVNHVNNPDKLNYVYDVNKSGAMLAWDYFVGGDYNYAVKLIGDRDIWTGLYEDTAPFALALRVNEFSIDDMAELLAHPYHTKAVETLVEQGKSYQTYNDYLVRQIASHAHPAVLKDGTLVQRVNCPLGLVSDVGNYVAENHDEGIALMVYYKNHHEVVFSLRVAQDKDFDAGAYCRDYHGGGGHAKAAGWVESIQYS